MPMVVGAAMTRFLVALGIQLSGIVTAVGIGWVVPTLTHGWGGFVVGTTCGALSGTFAAQYFFRLGPFLSR